MNELQQAAQNLQAQAAAGLGAGGGIAPGWIMTVYLVAAILFISGLKGLTHPRTAVRGNLISALGMFIAIVVTLLDRGILGYGWIIAGLAVGGVIGFTLGGLIRMTAMPQLVALFNGFGGLGSLFVAGAELYKVMHGYEGHPGYMFSLAVGVTGLIGSVTFFGSLVAYAKLEGFRWIPDGPLPPLSKQFTHVWGMDISVQTVMNLGLFVVSLGLCYVLAVDPGQQWAFWALALVVAAVLGITLTQPIGGADMPVVISLLNSYSGLAAAAAGFVIANTGLIIAGSLVGAAGLILTGIMCTAMNRSLPNVIFGTMAGGGEKMDADEIYKTVKATSAEEIAMLLDGVSQVMVVPGYGMAVSQAQHAVRDLTNILEERGVNVLFGVHPVAGRMPGHMNVLLAEADIPYEKLLDLDQANAEMDRTDLCLVLGANDVVNPVARDPKSAIAGMPIIDVDKAGTCVVIKRSLSPGFAGIPNPLFAMENTLMFFNDGKKAFTDLIVAVKEM